jgi:hypothetical protein
MRSRQEGSLRRAARSMRRAYETGRAEDVSVTLVMLRAIA